MLVLQWFYLLVLYFGAFGHKIKKAIPCNQNKEMASLLFLVISN